MLIWKYITVKCLYGQSSGHIDRVVSILTDVKIFVYTLYMISYEPLAKIMKDKGITLKELADKAGVKEEELRKKLNGREYITLRQLEKICNAVGEGAGDVIRFESNRCISVDWDKAVSRLTKNGSSLRMISLKAGKSEGYLSKCRKRDIILEEDIVNLIAAEAGCPLEDIRRK